MALEPDDDDTPVVFRMWEGACIALFPTMPGDMSASTCSSYQHIGQHGAADPWHIIAHSRPATPREYAPLHAELTGIGYRLAVYRRMQWQSFSAIKHKLLAECGSAGHGS